MVYRVLTNGVESNRVVIDPQQVERFSSLLGVTLEPVPEEEANDAAQ